MQATSSARVSVVIVNHNGTQFIERCIRSALAQNPLEVIVVDDASTDRSVDLIAKFPVQLLTLEQNVGPTAARNAGARQAKGDYILFVDGDAELGEGYVSGLLDVFNQHPKTGIVGGQIVESTTQGPMWFRYCIPASLWSGVYERTVCRFLFLLNDLVKKNGYELDTHEWWRWLHRFGHSNYLPEPARPIRVGWVVEIAFMARANAFREIGMFDEKYWMFFEGPDLCWRMKRAGYGVWYTPHAHTLHLGGHTGTSERRAQLFRTSQKIYTTKLFRSLFGLR